MKEELVSLFRLRDPLEAEVGWRKWFKAAKESGIPALVHFAEIKERRLNGLIAHAQYPISTGKLEGLTTRSRLLNGLAMVSRMTTISFCCLGINVKNVKLAMIMISSFFCGLAGVLYAMLNLGAFTTYLNVLISEEGLIMCLVGGMTCFWGPSIGAILITLVTVYIAGLTVYYKTILGVILITAILFFPNGILGLNRGGDGNKLVRFIGELFNEDSIGL